ncbi:hypothetical protein J5226_16270 [Lysobacter sp. K5869]|uniref:hypothetical protein n=1 Tax=Lysobacter sp. K5869 TaxID=2820808 RepID=UPI001C0627FA|nr:hypothetical protein [Lysobacter sp. K5869]QWP75175.1 hypothetical protein J5226_16270 [Lysobacter sp. K5869]
MLLVVALAGCAPKDDPQRRTAEAEAKAAGIGFTTEAAPAADPVADPAKASKSAEPPVAAAVAPASPEKLRERFQALAPEACRIESARAEGDLVRVIGSADSNAAIAAAMRAFGRAADGAEPVGRSSAIDLTLLEQKPDGRYHFEMNVRSAKLATP